MPEKPLLHAHRPLSSWCLALAAACAAGGAAAQTPPDAGRLLDETRLPPRPAPALNQPPRRLIEPPARPTVAMPEGVTVTPSGFRVSGAVSFPEAELAELAKPWVGRKLDLAGLNEAAGAITRRYQAAGHFLSYAYLPAQKVADGVIEIAVLEGRIEATQVANAQDVRLRDEVVQAHVDPLVDRQPATQPDVERKLLLLNDIPGVVARAAFTPGASPGAAEVVVSVAEEEPLAASITVDNHGSRSSGEFRAGLGMQFRDLFGWGDELQARLLASQRAGLVSGSLAGWLPLGGDGLKLGASVSSLRYALGGSFASTGAEGTARAFGPRLRYPLLRTLDANLTFDGSVERKHLRDDVQAVGRTNRKTATVMEGTLGFDLRDGLAGGGVTAGTVGFTSGTMALLDGPSTVDTSGDYRKGNITLSRQQTLFGPFSAVLRFVGQFAHRNLDSSEKLALGGPAGVRAYTSGEAVVDDGRFLSAELRYAQDYLGGNLLWSLFHERAKGRINVLPPAGATGNEPHLRGTGVGLQWSGGDFGLSATLAWRGSRPPTAEGGDPSPRAFFQLFYTP